MFGKKTFCAQIDKPRWVTNVWRPDAGAVVKVQVSPANDVRFDVKNDPQLSVKGEGKLRAEAFKRTLEG